VYARYKERKNSFNKGRDQLCLQMNKFAITFRRTCKLFSKIVPSGLGEILEMHLADFNDIDGSIFWCLSF